MAIGTGAAVLGSAFLGTAGQLYSNAVNSAAQYKINQDNIALQYAVNADQIEAARMNNQTAIELSNTAHQREVLDLIDAGLNPILSAHGSGAAVPSLDSPSTSAASLEAPTIQNPLASAASALQNMQALEDQHRINDAKLSALGFTGDKKADALNAARRSELAGAQINTALSQAEADRSAADVEFIRNEIQRKALTEVLGGSTGPRWDHNNVTVSPVDRMIRQSEYYDLIRQSIMSAAKDASNVNWRNNVHSAKEATDGLLDVGRLFVPAPKGVKKP